ILRDVRQHLRSVLQRQFVLKRPENLSFKVKCLVRRLPDRHTIRQAWQVGRKLRNPPFHLRGPIFPITATEGHSDHLPLGGGTFCQEAGGQPVKTSSMPCPVIDPGGAFALLANRVSNRDVIPPDDLHTALEARIGRHLRIFQEKTWDKVTGRALVVVLLDLEWQERDTSA